MGQERPAATLTRSSSSDRSDDAAHARRTTSPDYAPAVGQPAVGDVATTPALGGLALLAGPGVLRATAAVADPLGGTPIPDGVLSALRRRRGGGQPLTPGVAGQIGEQLGPAASAARIHTDGEADRLARSVQAVAFSYGSDVYFTQGAYAPHSQAGQRLLAHELSHVRQSASGSGGGGPVIGRADDAAERDADHSAEQVLGAFRRQAARRATPACGQTCHDGDVPTAGARPSGLPALARTVSELVRRAYTEQERPDVLALPQLENSKERLSALEAHTTGRRTTRFGWPPSSRLRPTPRWTRSWRG